MAIIGVSELQHNGRALLDRVRDNDEPMLITRYGQPVAALVPPGSADLQHLPRVRQVLVRMLMRNTKRVLWAVERAGRPFGVVRDGQFIAVLVPVARADIDRYVLAAAPQFLALRSDIEAAGTAGETRDLESVATQFEVAAPVPPRPIGPRDLVFDHVKRHLALKLKIDPERITYDASFDDLDADSLDLFELTMELEQTYGVDLPEGAARGILTVDDAVDFVVTYGAAPMIQAEARRIVGEFGSSKGSARDAVHEAYAQLPARAATLAGGSSESLTLEEFASAGRESPNSMDARASMLEPAIAAVVDLVTNPADGTISRRDFARWMTAVGVVDAPDADIAFDAIDVYGHGKVRRTEFLRALGDSQRGLLDVNLLGRSILALA